MAKKDGEMSFLEHLEELRWHIMRSLISIVVFGIIVFIAVDFVFPEIILKPKTKEFISYRAICAFSDWIGLGDRLCFYPPVFDLETRDFGEQFFVHIKSSFLLGFC